MDITDVRANNIKSILNVLRFNDGLIKKEIASTTELSFSTVSSTCNELKTLNIVSEQKAMGSGVGRLPNRISFNGNSFCALCLDLQNQYRMGLAVLNFNNEILHQRFYDISECHNAEEIICYAHTLWQELSYHPKLQNVTCVGIGIAIHGVFDKKSGTLIACPFPFFKDMPILQLITEQFHLPCYIYSKADFCAISMKQRMPDADNFIYLHLAEELSAGIICHGNLLTGQSGHGVRIGHLPLGKPERKCPVQGCHGYGCIETEISLHGMIQDYKNEITGIALQERWQQCLEEILAKPDAQKDFLEEKSLYLGRLLSVMISIFDPAMVFLGGKGAQLFDIMQPLLINTVKQRNPFAFNKGIQVCWDQDSVQTLFEGITQVVYDHWNPLSSTSAE